MDVLGSCNILKFYIRNFFLEVKNENVNCKAFFLLLLFNFVFLYIIKIPLKNLINVYEIFVFVINIFLTKQKKIIWKTFLHGNLLILFKIIFFLNGIFLFFLFIKNISIILNHFYCEDKFFLFLSKLIKRI